MIFYPSRAFQPFCINNFVHIGHALHNTISEKKNDSQCFKFKKNWRIFYTIFLYNENFLFDYYNILLVNHMARNVVQEKLKKYLEKCGISDLTY